MHIFAAMALFVLSTTCIARAQPQPINSIPKGDAIQIGASNAGTLQSSPDLGQERSSRPGNRAETSRNEESSPTRGVAQSPASQSRPENMSPSSNSERNYVSGSNPQGTGRAAELAYDPRPTLVGSAGLDDSVTTISQSPWFALVSGLASIGGLLIPLYATQVKSIPFSMYRSLVWRKQLLISGGVGLIVFAAAKVANFDGAARRTFEILKFLATKDASWFSYQSGYGLTIVWISLIFLGLLLFFKGVGADPIAEVREIIVREHRYIGEAREREISKLLGGRDVNRLTSYEQRSVKEILEYYRYVQWRYADVALGPPPPAFPIFREQRLASVEEHQSDSA